jgi:hypothetical protein
MPRAAHGVQHWQGPHQDHRRLGGEVLQVNYSSVLHVLYKGGAGVRLSAALKLDWRWTQEKLLTVSTCEIL